MAKTMDKARDRVSDARPLVERALKDQLFGPSDQFTYAGTDGTSEPTV